MQFQWIISSNYNRSLCNKNVYLRLVMLINAPLYNWIAHNYFRSNRFIQLNWMNFALCKLYFSATIRIFDWNYLVFLWTSYMLVLYCGVKLKHAWQNIEQYKISSIELITCLFGEGHCLIGCYGHVLTLVRNSSSAYIFEEYDSLMLVYTVIEFKKKWRFNAKTRKMIFVLKMLVNIQMLQFQKSNSKVIKMFSICKIKFIWIEMAVSSKC